MVVIITLHRSGSTFLLNLLGTVEHYYPLEDELNLYERFRGNTFEKILKTKNPYKLVREGKVYGSWFKYHQKYRRLFLNMKKIGAIEFITKLEAYIFQRYSKEMLAKYLVHYRKADLILKIPNTKLIFLLRSPKDQILSKLNDDSSKRRRQKWYGALYELILIIYFFVENVLYRKKIRKLFKRDNSQNLLIVNYEDLMLNREAELSRIMQFLGCIIEDSRSITGKSSSFLSGTIELRSLSRYLFNFLCRLN